MFVSPWTTETVCHHELTRSFRPTEAQNTSWSSFSFIDKKSCTLWSLTTECHNKVWALSTLSSGVQCSSKQTHPYSQASNTAFPWKQFFLLLWKLLIFLIGAGPTQLYPRRRLFEICLALLPKATRGVVWRTGGGGSLNEKIVREVSGWGRGTFLFFRLCCD